jgi:surfeit locus 1 family protein
VTRRLPIIPTVLVALAVATMIGLGVWQLQRAKWKEALLGQYAHSSTLPPVAFPTAPTSDPPLFRRATGYCLQPAGRTAVAGENRSGEPGYVHIVTCRTGAEGPGMAVQIGWSKNPSAPFRWSGGRVSGIIVRDRTHRIRLVSDRPAAGLEPSAAPDVRSISAITPGGHRMYAVTWFALAATALVIYLLVLRKRTKPE